MKQNNSYKHPLVVCFFIGGIGALILFIAILIDGQTFGQRAAEKYEYGSPEWKEEVQRLKEGK